MAQIDSSHIVPSLSYRWICAGVLVGVLVGAFVVGLMSIDTASSAPWIVEFIPMIVILPAVIALVLLVLPLHAGVRRRFGQSILHLRSAGFALSISFFTIIGCVMLYFDGIQSWKFNYLIDRVESAQTSQEEREAFQLAARWGHVWELNRVTVREGLPERAQNLRGDWVLELEWLESSARTGKPFRAYRVVIDEKNLDVLSND